MTTIAHIGKPYSGITYKHVELSDYNSYPFTQVLQAVKDLHSRQGDTQASHTDSLSRKNLGKHNSQTGADLHNSQLVVQS